MSYNSKYKGAEVEGLLDSIGNKVDKVDGKQLSTEDFTTLLKNKLDGLSNYDDTVIQQSVSKLRTDLDTLVSGDTTTAIKTFNEVIAFLDGLEDTEDLASIIGSIEQQIASKAGKSEIPTKVSQLENDSDFVKKEDVDVPDEEDITSVDNKLKFKDRTSDDGMGYVILRKDKTLAEQMTRTNTIYEIRYDFDLGGSLFNIPEGCTLKFIGGSVKNGTIVCSNTTIDGCASCISNLIIQGVVVNNIKLSWIGVFGNNSENKTNFNSLVNYSSIVFEADSDITFSDGDVVLKNNVTIIGNGHIISFTCNDASNALIILSDRCRLDNVKISSQSENYAKPILLADTEFNKVHTFWLSKIVISGKYNAEGIYNSIGLRISASNYKDNSQNYITGCFIRDLRIEFVKIGVEISCVNQNYSTADFAWLNEIHTSSMYISATECGVKTNYVDEGVTNKTNSVGPLYYSQFEFQALNNRALMFHHEGLWKMLIDNGFCYDSDYKGVIKGGSVEAIHLLGCYKTDGTYTDDDGKYKLIDSVKIYDGGEYNKYGNLMTPIEFRQEGYNPLSGTQYWRLGCNKEDFELSEGSGHCSRTLQHPNNYSSISHVRTAGAALTEHLYHHNGGGAALLSYALRYGINSNDIFILQDNHDAYLPTIPIITKTSNSVVNMFYSGRDVVAGSKYKGKLRVKFKGDITYTVYKSLYNYLTPSGNPIKFITGLRNVNSCYKEENGNLYIEWDGYCYSPSSISFLIETIYRNIIGVDSSFVNKKNDIYSVKIPIEAYIDGYEDLSIEEIKLASDTSSRPTNIEKGFQYFDTTINKPIWWNGESWVEEQDKLVSGTNIKTINGTSILGSGNITISGGGGSSSGGSGAYTEVNHGTSDTTFMLTPNTFHVWNEVASLDLSFADEIAGVANEFLFQFTSGATPTTLTLPDSIKWANDNAPTISESKIYQVSVLKGLGSVLEFNKPVELIVNRGTYNSGSMFDGATLTFEHPVASDLIVSFLYAESSSYTLPAGETTLKVDWYEPLPPEINGWIPTEDNTYQYIIEQ